MEASRLKSLSNIIFTKVSIGKNITTSGTYTCRSNLVRIVAIEDTIIKSSEIQNGDGILLPKGMREFFQTDVGEILSFTGSVNVSSIR